MLSTNALVARRQLLAQRRHYARVVSTAACPPRNNQVISDDNGRMAMSTVARPSVSYEEWAAAKKAEMAAAAISRSQDWRHQPPKPSTTTTTAMSDMPPRLIPRKYKSLVLFPKEVSLSWPNENKETNQTREEEFELNCYDFGISKPGKGGGHVVLGRNGSGKSLLVEYLAHQNLFLEDEKYSESIDQDENWRLVHPDNVAYVSFDSHLQALKEHPYRTVFDSITGGSGNLSKAAQYLVVRFGLFPLLHRTLSTLSTGEIRKSLLVSALSKEPRLLILENPFDGLDVTARAELQEIVSKTIQGLDKSGKLLVQGVQPDYVPPAQVILSTHRPEEIVDEITTVSLMIPSNNDTNNRNNNSQDLVTIRRPPGFSQEQLMYLSLGLDKDHNKNKKSDWSVLAPWQEDDPTLPSLEDIRQVWNDGNNNTTNDTLVSLENVEIRRRRDGDSIDTDVKNKNSEFATLLHPLSWNIQKGERWLIAGGNGAGKSTLSRFLLQSANLSSTEQSYTSDTTMVSGENKSDSTRDLISGLYTKDANTRVGWVSTESHLGQISGAHQDSDATEKMTGTSAWDTISHNGAVSDSVAETMIQWVFGSDGDILATKSTLKKHSLHELSQGQQKLALLASALALRPNVLILDEPTQGLDWVNRRRVLALLERICQAQDDDMSLVYITHYQEEWIPSISHVLHLDRGQAIYQGSQNGYDPAPLMKK